MYDRRHQFSPALSTRANPHTLSRSHDPASTTVRHRTLPRITPSHLLRLLLHHPLHCQEHVVETWRQAAAQAFDRAPAHPPFNGRPIKPLFLPLDPQHFPPRGRNFPSQKSLSKEAPRETSASCITRQALTHGTLQHTRRTKNVRAKEPPSKARSDLCARPIPAPSIDCKRRPRAPVNAGSFDPPSISLAACARESPPSQQYYGRSGTPFQIAPA